MSVTDNFSIHKGDAEIKTSLLQPYNLDGIDSRFSIFWCLIVGVMGVLLRFYRLGSLPLSDIEVENALLAWLIVDGQKVVDTNWLANSALVNFSQIVIFWITDNANPISARIISALCGSVLIFSPLWFVRYIGKVGAGVTMALLAVSPSLVMISRTADGMSIALVCLVIALLGFERVNSNDKGNGIGMIILGLVLGIMCGLSFIIPFLFITFILVRYLHITKLLLKTFRTTSFGSALAYIVIGLLIVTSFFRYKYGFMVLTEPWMQWFSGWSSYNRMRPGLLTADIIVVNQPLLILLSIVGLGIALHGRSLERNLLMLSVCGLFYGIAYSGVQSRDVVWVIIPLFILCARVGAWASEGQWSRHELIAITIQGVILGSLMVFGYIVFGGLEFTFRTPDYSFDRYILTQVLILVGMLVLVVTLFSLGWSARVSTVSVIIVMLLLSTVWSIHRSYNMVRAPTGGYTTNWHKMWPTGSDELMLKTLENLSLRYVGQQREVDIRVVAPYNRHLAWKLREFTNVKWDESSAVNGYPAVILSPGADISIRTGPGYIGQEFRLYEEFHDRTSLISKDNRNFKSRPIGSTFDTIVVWTRQGDKTPN